MKPGDTIITDRQAPRTRNVNELTDTERANLRPYKGPSFDACNDCWAGDSSKHFMFGNDIVCPAKEDDDQET